MASIEDSVFIELEKMCTFQDPVGLDGEQNGDVASSEVIDKTSAFFNPRYSMYLADDKVKWINNPASQKKWMAALDEYDIEKMKKHIENGAPYVLQGSEDWGPLYLAAFCSRADVIELIIEKHKNLRSAREDEFQSQASSALLETCKTNNRTIAKLLLDAETHFSAQHIHETAKYGSWVVLEEILKKSSNPTEEVNAQYDDDGDTPLHIAARNGFTPTARFLLDNGANPNTKNQKGESSLHLACLTSKEDIVRLLIEHNAEVNAVDNNGRNPIYYAADKGRDSIIPLLANAKSELDRRDNFGNVPLITAVKNGHTATMKELILNGASLEIVDNQRFNALEIAFKQNRDLTAATYIRLEPTHDYLLKYIESIEFSIFKVVKNKLTESTKALLDRMVLPYDDLNINKAIVLTKYLEVDENKNTPIGPIIDGVDAVYDKNKSYFVQRINDLGEQSLAYHGVVRLLVDEKMKKFGYYFLFFKAIFFTLFILALAYSLIIAARNRSPVNSYLSSAQNIIQVIFEIYVFCYWLVNIGTEITEIYSIVKLSHSHLRDRREERKKDIKRERLFSDNSVPNDENENISPEEQTNDETTINKITASLRKLKRHLIIRVIVDYFEDKSNYFDVAGLASLFILFWLRIFDHPIQWIFATFTLFVNSMRLFKFITLIPGLGPYALIIFQILIKDVPKFAGMFLLTVLIYSSCFFVALRTPHSIIGFLNNSLGEDTVRIEGVDNEVWWVFLSGIRVLLEGNFIEMNYIYQRYNWLAASIYLLFLFLIVVVYLNVFIAQLSDTYSDTKKKANIFTAWFRLNFIIQSQRTSLLSLLFDIRKKTFIDEIEIDKEKLQKYFKVSSYPEFHAKTIFDNHDASLLLHTIEERQKIGRRAQEISLSAIKNTGVAEREDIMKRLTKLENTGVAEREDIMNRLTKLENSIDDIKTMLSKLTKDI